MNLPLPMAFDLGDLIGIAIVILFVVIPLIGQVLSKLREAAKVQQAPRPQAPRPATDQVNAEIEEFLRRAGQRRAARPGRAPSAAEELRRRTAPGTPPSRKAESPVQAEIVEEAPVGSAIARRAEKKAQSREISQRTARLGKDVVVADEQFGQHIQQTFGREVSRLARKPGETATATGAAPVATAEVPAAAPPGSVAPALAALLTNPQSLCQAIILNEILQRKEV